MRGIVSTVNSPRSSSFERKQAEPSSIALIGRVVLLSLLSFLAFDCSALCILLVGLVLGTFGALGASSSSISSVVAIFSVGVSGGGGVVISSGGIDDFAFEKIEVQLGDGLSEVALAGFR